MKKTFIGHALLIAASSAGLASAATVTPTSTPLSRYLPAGALGTLEAHNLRDALKPASRCSNRW